MASISLLKRKAKIGFLIQMGLYLSWGCIVSISVFDWVCIKGWCKKNDTTIVKINIAAFSDYNCILYWLVKLITEFLSFQKAIQTIFIGFIDLVAQIYEHFGIDVFIHFIDFIFWPPTLTVPSSLAAPWDTKTYNTSLERSDYWLLSG